jgi:hypothetical protein
MKVTVYKITGRDIIEIFGFHSPEVKASVVLSSGAVSPEG